MMRAMSRLSPLAGISTVWWAAMIPLRMRVRKSATGSVIDMRSPARLRHAGDEAVVRELAQADPAQAELAVHGARAAAAAAARVGPRGVLRRACLTGDLALLGHWSLSLSPLRRDGVARERLEGARPTLPREGHAQRVEQGKRLGVG